MYTGRHSNSASAKKLPHPFHPRNARLPTHQSDSNASRFPTNPTLQSDIDGSTFSRKRPFSISSPQFDPNAESNDDVSEPQAPPVQTKQRARGRTKMLKSWGEKAYKVDINELNQAVGETAGIMASQMGRKVKQGNLFSLLCKDWRMMDSHVKESTWEEFQANFSLQDRHKKEFLKHLGVLWKNWKHHVKENYYYAYETDAERLANCPDEIVEKAQWPKVVEYWSSEDGQRASNRNKLNRSKLRVIARTGRKSFATLRDEVIKEKGDISDYDFWMLTKVGLAKTPLDARSSKLVKNLEIYINQHPDAINSKENRDKVLAMCLGAEKPGQMRTYGFGPTPSQISALKHQKEIYEEKVSTMLSALRDSLKEEIKNELKDLIEETVREAVHLLMKTNSSQDFPTQKNAETTRTRAQSRTEQQNAEAAQARPQSTTAEMPQYAAPSSHGNPEPKRKMDQPKQSNAPKKLHNETRAACPPFKVRKDKLGDKIAALQQLVAPFGKNAETAQARPQSTTTKHVPSSSFHATQTEPFSKQHDVPVPRNDTRKQNPTRTVFPGVSKNVGWDLFTK